MLQLESYAYLPVQANPEVAWTKPSIRVKHFWLLPQLGIERHCVSMQKELRPLGHVQRLAFRVMDDNVSYTLSGSYTHSDVTDRPAQGGCEYDLRIVVAVIHTVTSYLHIPHDVTHRVNNRKRHENKTECESHTPAHPPPPGARLS